MDLIPAFYAFYADVMYALMWLCVVASVCSTGAWLWWGQDSIGSKAPRYERGEATFMTFWILLSGACLFGPFALLFHRSPDSSKGPSA